MNRTYWNLGWVRHAELFTLQENLIQYLWQDLNT